MSYNPTTGLVYLPTIHIASQYSDTTLDLASWRSPDWKAEIATSGTGVVRASAPVRTDGVFGTLQAWDPVKKTRV